MCPQLDASFAPDLKTNTPTVSPIIPQSIIVLRIPSFNLGYDKFIVLITTSADGEQMAAVCINTKPSPKGNHIIIKQKEYSFLSYDSHIDCSSIVPFEKKWLETLLKRAGSFSW